MLDSYRAICKKNQYLYGQLENLTLLMGHAQVHGLTERYDEYAAEKVKLKKRIAENLDKLEQYWEQSIREAARIAEWRTHSTESKVIRRYLQSESKSISAIAIDENISEWKASRIITNYLTKKYDEVA